MIKDVVKFTRQPMDTFFFVFPHVNEQNKKVEVAQALSDLVIYTRSVKFMEFTYSRDNQNCNENTSIEENKARKLVKTSSKMLFVE